MKTKREGNQRSRPVSSGSLNSLDKYDFDECGTPRSKSRSPKPSRLQERVSRVCPPSRSLLFSLDDLSRCVTRGIFEKARVGLQNRVTNSSGSLGFQPSERLAKQRGERAKRGRTAAPGAGRGGGRELPRGETLAEVQLARPE